MPAETTPSNSAPSPAPRPTLGTRIRLIPDALRGDYMGGILLIIAAVLAVAASNIPGVTHWYFAVRDAYIDVPLGFTTLHLSVAHWCADGLLALFFYVVGLDLKNEFVNGALRNWRQAVTPVVAAAGGVIVPALIFTLIVITTGAEGIHGWATPTATDIAFALAILAVVGRWLPSPLRVFLMTLAVVDDLIAILIIAIFYAHGLSWAWLAATLVPFAAYWLLVHTWPGVFARHAWVHWLVLLPIGIVMWVCMFKSGVHATIAGVALGLITPARTLVPLRPGARRVDLDAEPATASASDTPPALPLVEVFSHRLAPWSAGLAVPIFAFFSAGVAIGGWTGFVGALEDPVFWGVMVGLVVGKPIGIMASTWIITRTPLGRLDPQVTWTDLFGVGIVAGVGFTVAMLVSDLSFGLTSALGEHSKIAILLASVLATVLAAVWLAPRNRYYKGEASDFGTR